MEPPLPKRMPRSPSIKVNGLVVGAPAPRPPAPPRPPAGGANGRGQPGIFVAVARGDGRGKLLVTGSRLPGRRRGIHQNEFRAAFYRPGIPEVIGLADPVGRARNIDHQALRPSGKRLAAPIIG